MNPWQLIRKEVDIIEWEACLPTCFHIMNKKYAHRNFHSLRKSQSVPPEMHFYLGKRKEGGCSSSNRCSVLYMKQYKLYCPSHSKQLNCLLLVSFSTLVNYFNFFIIICRSTLFAVKIRTVTIIPEESRA